MISWLTSSKLRTELVWITKTLLPAPLISISKFHPDSLAQSINLILRVNYLEDLIQSEHGSSKSTSYHTLGAHMNPRAHPRPEGRRLHTERPTMVIEIIQLHMLTAHSRQILMVGSLEDFKQSEHETLRPTIHGNRTQSSST